MALLRHAGKKQICKDKNIETKNWAACLGSKCISLWYSQVDIFLMAICPVVNSTVIHLNDRAREAINDSHVCDIVADCVIVNCGVSQTSSCMLENYLHLMIYSLASPYLFPSKTRDVTWRCPHYSCFNTGLCFPLVVHQILRLGTDATQFGPIDVLCLIASVENISAIFYDVKCAVCQLHPHPLTYRTHEQTYTRRHISTRTHISSRTHKHTHAQVHASAYIILYVLALITTQPPWLPL